jgi:hypothetical protein
MLHAEIKIGDAIAAASAFGTLSRSSGPAKIPDDQSELTARLSRVGGRARPLAAALNKYIETHGFDAFRTALENGRGGVPASADVRRADADAAATVSIINFDELDHRAMTFASSGLY